MKDLGVEIEAVARATPGVVALYRTRSMLANLVSATTEQLTAADDVTPRAVVTASGDSTRVEIAIGIAQGASAGETAREVRERVAALLAARGVTQHFIRLTVVHVAEQR